MPSDSDHTSPNNQPPLEGEVLPAPRVAEFGRPAPGQLRAARAARPAGGIPATGGAFDQSFLRNPYVLAGLAVGGAILLAIVVVVLFGSSGSAGNGDDSIVIPPLTPGAGRGLTARSVSQSTVREGPALDYVAIGELSRNQDVEIVGRNEEGTWYNIYFPPGSSLRGWVPASALRLPSNTAAIPVVATTPIPRPTFAPPTTPPEPTESATATATATSTGAAGGSDLAATIAPGTCAVDRRLIVNIRNLGPAPITNRAISILVQTPDGSQRAFATTTATIPPGGQIDVDTTYLVRERVFATVDPLGTLGDPNPSNNRVDCVVSAVPTAPSGTTTVVPPPIVTATPTRTPGP